MGDPAPDLTRTRALVVDDNVDGARLLLMSLELMGQECRVAHDGPSALEAAEAFAPHVVFCDIGLPGMDGYEVARRIRDDPRTARALLVAVTGWCDEAHRRSSREAGFDLHLTKPVHRTAIEEVLARLAPVAEGEPG